MKYLSVCSGIEAATVAWHPLGFEPVAYCEIEAFPSAVLAHHYSTIPNYGDFTRLIDAAHPVHVAGVDLLVGGTPCQAFSVAGLRRGLADPRGGLTLEFVRLAQALRPKWIVWENVPGVLSQDGGRAFGAFLGALGELGYGWAYRVLDAQWFGVAQRRRRVFVVACAGGDSGRAAAVLFEPESVRRDPPTRGEAGQGTSCPAATGADSDCRKYNARQSNERRIDRGRSHWDGDFPHPTLNQSSGGSGGGTSNQELFSQRGAYLVPQPLRIAQTIAHVDVVGALSDGAHNGGGLNGQDAYTGRVLPVVQCVTGERTHALKAEGADGSEDGTGRGTPIVTSIGFYPTEGRDFPAFHELSPTVKVGSGGTSGNPPGVMSAMAIAPAITASNDPSRSPQSSEVTQQVAAVHAASMAVRRLTPVECERLQGFPDEYTRIPWKKKPADECPDGPRYKALGNSMAVPVMRWIGERIAKVEKV